MLLMKVFLPQRGMSPILFFFLPEENIEEKPILPIPVSRKGRPRGSKNKPKDLANNKRKKTKQVPSIG